MDNNTIAIILTGLGSLIAGIFGKDGWKYLTRKKEIEAELSCKEKIAKLEKLIAEEKLKMSKVITGVDLLLTMLEEDYGDDIAHQNVIKKVRKSINSIVKPSQKQTA